MRRIAKLSAALLTAAAIPLVAHAATIGGVQYATQYDYNEFRQAHDGKVFRVEMFGNPFASMAADDTARRLLPVMQAGKPRVKLTFTYDKPVEKQRPDYRLTVIFDPANDLGGDSVCNGAMRHRPAVPGKVYVFGVYCRNDLALSQTTAWVDASSPEDPQVAELFSQLFRTLFDDSPARVPQLGGGSGRQ